MTDAHSIDGLDHQFNGASHDDALIDCNIADLHYGKFKAVRDVVVKLQKGTITAFIGPSGCGKSTVLRCLNRMNDLVRGFRLKGRIIFRGQDIYASRISMHPGSTLLPSGGISGWCFSSPILSR